MILEAKMNGKIAMIGGLDRLLPHYKKIAKVFGCDLCYHCGRCQCSQEKGRLLNLVRKADAIFCPVDINSHVACGLIKKFCKEEGKPFFFLRNPSVSSFKSALALYLEKY